MATDPRESWPPPPPDTQEHSAEVLDGARLRTVSPGWDDDGGARIAREYTFAPNGDFVISHSISKTPESRAIGAA